MQKMDNRMSSIETSVTKINSVDEKLTKLTTSFSMLGTEVKDIKARCTELEDSQRGLGNLIEKVQKKCETNQTNIVNTQGEIKQLKDNHQKK